MFLDSVVGNLTESLSDRSWNRRAIAGQIYRRIAYYQSQGMTSSDHVFVHYGNNLEFFADLIAIWCLGGCVVPIDSRLIKFEVETLARAARPRFSLWHGAVDESLAATLSSLDIEVLETWRSSRCLFAGISSCYPEDFAREAQPRERS